jgi:hypothetical protein
LALYLSHPEPGWSDIGHIESWGTKLREMLK